MQVHRARPLEGENRLACPSRIGGKRMKMKSSPRRLGVGAFSPYAGRSGFSLVELVICIGILTTGIIFVVEIFSTMLNASTKGADWSVATYIAASQLDAISANPSSISTIAQTNPYYAPPMEYHASQSEPVAVAAVNNTTYYITIRIQKLNNLQTPAGTSKQLYNVDTRVQWFGPSPASGPGASATGYGKLTTEMARLVYVH